MTPDEQQPPPTMTMAELMASLNTPEAKAARLAQEKEKPPQKKKRLDGALESGGRHSWAKGLYHIRYQNRIFRYGNSSVWTLESFNSEFAIEKPTNPATGTQVEPSVFLKKFVGFKESVDNASYAAGFPERFEFGGLSFVNLYHPDSVPQTASEYTQEGLEHVQRLRRHLLFMTSGNTEHAHIIESWIALNVREPGRLVGWAIMMKGIQGDGKSTLFHEMMTSLLGQSNVGAVGSKEIKSDFNPWAYGKAYRHLAELKATGMSRYEVEDTLKPHITDPTVRMVGKGANGEDIPNRTNYVGTTNHEDSMPLSNDDRRWFIIFTPWKSKEEMIETIGCEDHDTYFNELRRSAYECGPYMRKYLLEMELHPAVFHGSRAQDTEFKTRMVQAEFTNVGGDEFDTLLESAAEDGKKVYGISNLIVVPKVLGAMLAGAVGRDAPRQKTLAALILSRGFHPVEPKIKWRTIVRRVYVKDKKLADRANAKAIEAYDEIRRLLDATVPADAFKFNGAMNESENVVAYEEAMMTVWAGKKPSSGNSF